MERSLNPMEPPAVPAASAARVGRTPNLSVARVRGPPPQTRETLRFCVVAVVLLSLFGPAATSSVHDHLADLQGLEQSSLERLCPAGQYLEENGECKPCTDGVEFTDQPNTLDSCFPCKECKADQTQKSRCTPTRNTECQCKPGTFRSKDDTEHCKKCTVCTSEEIEESPCSLFSDRKCVYNVTRNLTNTILETHTSQLSQGCSICLGILGGIVVVVAVVVVVVLWRTQTWKKMLAYLKSVGSGQGQDSKYMNSMRHSTLNSQTSGTDSHNDTVSSGVKAPEVVVLHRRSRASEGLHGPRKVHRPICPGLLL